MSATLTEWLNLGLRWFHVIAGIAWIGSSFYFMWLDAHLKKPEPPKEGVEGQLWMVHSGGFYQVDKFLVAPATMPKELHWFKWEAYATWITGFVLLNLLYYHGADIYLIDPMVMALSPMAATGIGLGSLVVGWIVYDGLCRSPIGRNSWAFAAVGVVLMAGVAFGYSQVFSGRGAYIHVGAFMGTLMAVNVSNRIIPAQKQMVKATELGQPRDASLGLRAKQRSVHNNYMTLPVVFIMLSNHFPMTFGHPWNWAILVGLSLVGAVIRHFFNLKNKGQVRIWIPVAALVAGISLALVTAPRTENTTPSAMPSEPGAPVPFSAVQAIVSNRCVPCHSMTPSDEMFPMAPNGVMLDRPDQIQTYAQRIGFRAVEQQTMPLLNRTQMTLEERQTVGRWLLQGAPLQ